jgi:hypothetical protein
MKYSIQDPLMKELKPETSNLMSLKPVDMLQVSSKYVFQQNLNHKQDPLYKGEEIVSTQRLKRKSNDQDENNMCDITEFTKKVHCF